jgi:hypothetical protein
MSGLFSEDLRASLRALVESSEINDSWLKGIKKGWKALVTQTKGYKGRVTGAPDMDQGHIQEAAYHSTEALTNVLRYVRRLREDLLINKGFWALPASKKGDPLDIQEMKAKVSKELDDAEEAVQTSLSGIEHTRSETRETNKLGYPGNAYADAHKSQERFDWYLRSFGVLVDEAMDAADAAISGRLFRHISKLVAKSQPAALDFGEIPPPVVHVGDSVIVFHDIPQIGTGTVPSPARIGTQSDPYDSETVELTGLGKRGYMNPRKRQGFIDGVKEAQSRLQAKGLGSLNRIEFHVYPKSKAPQNSHGAQWGVGGEYFRKGDFIVIYDSIAPAHVSILAVHEIGHRYWFKHMTTQDRENFSKWFGDVPAVSEYGGTDSAEDFAEVFAHYVFDKKLTKGQRDRFKQFMRGKAPRTEAVEAPFGYVTVFHSTRKTTLPQIRSKGLTSSQGYSSAGWYMVSEDFGSADFHAMEHDDVVIEFRVPTEGKVRDGKPVKMWDGFPYLWKPKEIGDWEGSGPTRWWALKQPLPPEFIVKVHPSKHYSKRVEHIMEGVMPPAQSAAQSPQKCAFCDNPAVKSFLYANGREHVPACANHFQEAKDQIRDEGDSVVGVVDIIPSPLFRREGADSESRMRMALEKAPAFAYEHGEPGEGFGRRVDSARRQSALTEQPPRAPIGRADVPRGVTFPSRNDHDIMGLSGKPLRRTSTEPLKTISTEPIQRVAGVEIPDSLLKMLGLDWKSLKAFRQHDNRLLVNVDGVRFTVYTRRG